MTELDRARTAAAFWRRGMRLGWTVVAFFSMVALIDVPDDLDRMQFVAVALAVVALGATQFSALQFVLQEARAGAIAESLRVMNGALRN